MVSRLLKRRIFVACTAAAIFAAPMFAYAGGHRFFRNNSVGGISIDPTGVVAQPSVESARMLRADMVSTTDRPVADLARPVPLRMVSLRGLEAAIVDAMENNLGRLPDEVKYLAGIQRIQHVFVYPEQNDIVLAGPGEGWKIDEVGNVVGVTTGRPVIQLEDLLVAFRSVNNAANGEGISCSIDPTAEGQTRLNTYLRSLRTFGPGVAQGVERAMGPQVVSVTGVPTDSHFARVLVAADYKMKRYAMKLDRSPVPDMVSFIDLLKARGIQPKNITPRWWMATAYEPLVRSENGLAWEIRGQGVKCMTEDDFVNEAGERVGSGKKSDLGQQWADLMTKHYDELSGRDPVFGELRNLMDLCVVAALIEKEAMLKTAGLSLPAISGQDKRVELSKWHAPKSVATQCGFTKIKNRWVITASGGVQVESWDAVERAATNDEILQVRTEAGRNKQPGFWWN